MYIEQISMQNIPTGYYGCDKVCLGIRFLILCGISLISAFIFQILEKAIVLTRVRIKKGLRGQKTKLFVVSHFEHPSLLSGVRQL